MKFIHTAIIVPGLTILLENYFILCYACAAKKYKLCSAGIWRKGQRPIFVKMKLEAKSVYNKCVWDTCSQEILGMIHRTQLKPLLYEHKEPGRKMNEELPVLDMKPEMAKVTNSYCTWSIGVGFGGTDEHKNESAKLNTHDDRYYE